MRSLARHHWVSFTSIALPGRVENLEAMAGEVLKIAWPESREVRQPAGQGGVVRLQVREWRKGVT